MSRQTQKSPKYFVFMDETGNNDQERFFGLGILIIPVKFIGTLYNSLDKYRLAIKNLSQKNMQARLKRQLYLKNYKTLYQQAVSKRKFELKFKYINQENQHLYAELIREYFKHSYLRFSIVVFDKATIPFHNSHLSHWERYLHNAAMLIANNIKDLSQGQFVILADQITQPTNTSPSYEISLKTKILSRLTKKNINVDPIFGITRLESDASMFLQMTDILIGSVVYDFYKHHNIRKDYAVKTLRNCLRLDNLDKNFTKHHPNYFSVWKFKKNGVMATNHTPKAGSSKKGHASNIRISY